MSSSPAPASAPTLFDGFRRVRFFTSLDGLRAFSIIAVIWHHTAAAAVPASIGILHRGNRGVTLFFAVSAFLICTLLLRAKEKGGIDVPRFFARRALRILPLFYAVLSVYVAYVIFVEPDRQAAGEFLHNLPAFATFTSNWFVSLDSPRVIFYFAWTLAAEEQFYLCWPWAERYLSHIRAISLAVGVLVLSQVIGYVFAGNYAGYLPLRMIASVPAAILLGVILAHVLDKRQGFEWMASFAGRRGSAVVALLMVFAALNAEDALGFAGELLTSFAVTLLVATCVIREDNDLAALLRFKPIAWIGTVSYGIYLMHMLSVGAARRALATAGTVSPYADFFFGALLSIGVASLSYLTYEKIFLRLKDRWFSETRAKAAPTVARSVPTGVPVR